MGTGRERGRERERERGDTHFIYILIIYEGIL